MIKPPSRLLLHRAFAGLMVWLCFWGNDGKSRRAEGDRLYIVGSQGFGLPMRFSAHPYDYGSKRPFIGVLETDAWSHSLDNGALLPVAEVPIPHSFFHTVASWFRRKPSPGDLMCGARFTAEDYLQKIHALRTNLPSQRDVLLYYGGVRKNQDPQGLNFNAWSLDQLRRLHALGGQPFIGLETVDADAIDALVKKLSEAGLGKREPLYIRVASEPSGMGYGTEEGTAQGRRHTSACYQAYQRRFGQAACQLQRLRERYRMNIKIVFAGTSREDFERYAPSIDLFDDIGYDLYVTPANKENVLALLRTIARRFGHKPLVIPELGIATAGPFGPTAKHASAQASPAWGREALADVLVQLGKHPARVKQITIFSVNVAERMDARRWNWSWSPVMFEILKEWEKSPPFWRKRGFHAYDPLSYPPDQDILFLNRPDLRIYYRRLKNGPEMSHPQFLKNTYLWRDSRWIRTSHIVTYPSES